MKDTKTPNYGKVGTYYMVGNLFNKGIAFLTVPIFTRILSTTDYGIITTYYSWIAILSMIVGFALHMGIRMAFVDYKDKIDDFMSTTLTFTLESGLVLIISVVLCIKLIRVNIPLTLVVLCLLQSISAAIAEDYSMYLMMKFRYIGRTAIMVLPNIISVIISICAILYVVNEKLYMGRIVPTAIVYIVVGVILAVLTYRKSHVLHNAKYIKYGLAISTPLVLHGVALNILSQSDRTMITWLADASQTGIYSLIYNFSMLATVITTSLEGVWAPWFMKKYELKDFSIINKRSVEYVHLVTYAMVCLILIGPEVIKLLASSDYWQGIAIIPPVVIANYIIFLYSFYVNVEHYNKKTIYISLNTAIVAILNIILNYIFIPIYGYPAAAYTTLVSYLIALILHARYAKKLEKNLYAIKTFIPSLVHILLATLLFYMFENNPIIRINGLLVYIMFMSFINREKILILLYQIKR